ncbi:aminotransferase class IV family protein [Frankia sp. Cas3]|uniref:aminotransferase class IV family protein n=1 Tax=Frankia sp. Cas3 TaxID=3073926 RepID=UPI002AD3ECD1|nr:aminotransferase class IV family protein [Frankia sp. Cas3]
MMELDGVPVGPDELAALALTNYGHFTSMRMDNHRVRGLSLHLDRLVHDCRAVFGADLDPQKVRDLARRASCGETGSFMIRITIFDPAFEIGNPAAAAEPRVLVTTRPPTVRPLPALRLRSVRYCRDMPTVKHVGLFGSLRHRRDAQLGGLDDAVFTDMGSFVSEGATWNIGFFDGDRVVWPDADCLTGVTMTLLKRVHERTVTAPLRLTAIRDMQAAFATNAAIGVRAISAIDDIETVGDHPIIQLLRKEYLDIPGEPL